MWSLHVLCHVVKCVISEIWTDEFFVRLTDDNGQIVFWPNDSNGTKRVIETDITDINWRVVIVMARRLGNGMRDHPTLSNLYLIDP